MLQFWKKSKSENSPKKVKNGSIQISSLEQELSACIGPLSKFKYDIVSKSTCTAKSRLSLTIENAIDNKIALSYLSQFMDSRGHTNIFNLLADLEHLPVRIQLRKSLSIESDESPKHLVSVRKIYERYLSEEAPFKVKLSDETKLQVLTSLSSDKPETCLSHIREAVFSTIKKDIWVDFVKSDWYCKYQIELMTSGTMTLSDVLYNDACLGAFADFLEQEDLGALMDFWLEANNFEKKYSCTNDAIDTLQIQNDAILIYDKYLSLQATTPLGISDKIRFAIEEGICGETSTACDCLKPAQVLVEVFLTQTCLRCFFSSQQYLNLLSDVMTTSSSGSKSNISPASSITDGSIEHSKTSHGPIDPDGLWRRRKHNSGLSFGRIDQLGRYETDIEPEPEKRSSSRISRVVKLLLNKDEQKAQEEMAWRVAEMIVKDITSITMGSPDDNL